MKQLTVKQKKILDWLAVIFMLILIGLGLFLMAVGISKVNDAGKEDVMNRTQNNKPVILNATTVTYPDDPSSLLNFIFSDFKTKDVFAVSNPINYTIVAVPNDHEKIANVSVIDLPSDRPFQFRAGQDITIFIEQSNRTGHLVQLNKNDDNTYSINSAFSPQNEEQKLLLVLVHGRTTGIEPIIVTPKLTIYPHTAKLQADTNRDMINQIFETSKTNNIVEGLSWIVVAWIPLGFAYEIYRLRFNRK